MRSTSIGAASPLKLWFHRFSFVLLVTTAFAFVLIGRADVAAVSKLRMWLADLIAPVAVAVSQPVDATRQAVSDVEAYIALRSTVERLQRENDELRLWHSTARNLQAENLALREMLKMTPDPRASFVSARVVADSSSGYVRGVIALAGEAQSVTKGQIAMNGVGVVGRVQEVGKNVSRILLLTDINSRVPAIVERTRDQAILAGNNTDLPQLRYLARDADIKVGDRIATSGAGGAFPSGLPIGEVISIENGRIEVQPLADLARLEVVRIVNYRLTGILKRELDVDTAGGSGRSRTSTTGGVGAAD